MAAPLTLALANTEWLFTPAGYLDPFQYVGLFLNYDQPDFLPQHYKLARLPWVLSGYLAHRALPPDTASLVLHGAYLALAVAAAYVAVWIAFRDVALALFVALALGFFPPFHGSGGWDYHNTAAGAFYLVTIALLHGAVWSSRRRPVTLFGAGVALALTLHSNIVFVSLVPFSVGFFVVLVSVGEGWQVARRWALLGALWMAAGGLVVTAALCGVSVLAGRDPLFFWPLVEIVLRYVGDPGHEKRWWIAPSGLWKAEISYLSVPAAVAVASVVAFLVPAAEGGEERRRRVAARLLVAQFLAACASWVFWQVAGHTALAPDYFAYPLLPLCFLAVAGILRRHGRWSAGRGGVFLCAVAAAVFWVALAGEVSGRALRSWPGLSQAVFLPAFALALVGLLGFIAFRGSRVGLLGCAVLLAGANAFSFPYWSLTELHYYGWTDRCRLRRDVFKAIVDASKFIWEVDRGFDTARVWFPEESSVQIRPGCIVPVGRIAYSVTEAATSGRYLARPMRAIEELPEEVFFNAARTLESVVVITHDAQDVDRMRSRFLRLGLSVAPFRQAHIRSGDVAFSVYALRDPAAEKPPEESRLGQELVHLEGRELQLAWQVHVYGRRRKGRLAKAPGDLTLFESTTRRDHLALSFVEMPPVGTSEPSRVRRALLEASVAGARAAGGTCRIFIQNEVFIPLGGVPCPDEHQPTVRSFIVIPEDTKRVRVYVTNGRARQTSIVPGRVRLVTIEPSGRFLPAGLVRPVEATERTPK